MNTYCEPSRAAAVGMFDGVHLGHRQLIGELSEIAHSRGMIPTIFTFDRHPLDLVAPEKSPQLLTTPVQRGRLLIKAGAEDVFVLVFNNALRNFSAREFLCSLRDHYGVKLLLVGFNHRFGHDHIESFEEYRKLGEECGVEVVRAKCRVDDNEEHAPVSSSAIRAALAQGNLDHAIHMLGHPYVLSGIVVHGNAIGRQLGFPTANLSPVLGSQLIPATGVYAANAVLHGSHGCSSHPGMVSIGFRPTVSSEPALRIETHIIGFEGNLYDKHLELQLIARMRDERKFKDTEELSAQLAVDREHALEIYRNFMTV